MSTNSQSRSTPVGESDSRDLVAEWLAMTMLPPVPGSKDGATNQFEKAGRIAASVHAHEMVSSTELGPDGSDPWLPEDLRIVVAEMVERLLQQGELTLARMCCELMGQNETWED